MSSKTIVVLELVLVLGAALGFGVWQLISLNRYERKDRERCGAADDAEDRDNGGTAASG